MLCSTPLRRIVLLCAVLLVAACGAKVAPPLTPEQRSAYAVTEVNVDVPESAEIWWGSGERRVLSSKGLDPDDQTAATNYFKTAEGSAALRSLAKQMIEPVTSRVMRTGLVGPKPAHLAVRVEAIWIASSAQQVVFGGHHTIRVDVQLFDLETGASLTKPQRMFGLGGGGGGLIGAVIDAAQADPILRVAESFSTFTRDWLMASEEYTLPIVEEQNTTPAPLPAPQAAAPASQVVMGLASLRDRREAARTIKGDSR